MILSIKKGVIIVIISMIHAIFAVVKNTLFYI